VRFGPLPVQVDSTAPAVHGDPLPAPFVVAASFLVGSIPFCGIAARVLRGVDLRQVGTGTVSGSALYQVAGFVPLAGAGILDVAKGALGPWLAGPHRRGLGALAAAAAICGHNWSPLLRGAGGRGISPGIGALLVLAPEGAGVVLGGLAVGRIVRQTAAVTLASLGVLAVLLGRRRGRPGLATAASIGIPIVAKRLAGNRLPRRTPRHELARVLLSRLLFDRDPA